MVCCQFITQKESPRCLVRGSRLKPRSEGEEAQRALLRFSDPLPHLLPYFSAAAHTSGVAGTRVFLGAAGDFWKSLGVLGRKGNLRVIHSGERQACGRARCARPKPQPPLVSAGSGERVATGSPSAAAPLVTPR